MKALILYDSFTGNTEKVVEKIYETLKKYKNFTEIVKLKTKKDFNEHVEILDFDIVFIGSPVIQFLPSINLMNFCKKHLAYYLKKGIIIPKSPKFKGKYAVPFVSYGGMHTGIREAIPALKYIEQFLEHLRFEIVDELYIVGEYKTPEFSKFNKDSLLGDISGRPDENDLQYVESKITQIIFKIEKNKKISEKSEYFPEILKFIDKNYPDIKNSMFDFINQIKSTKVLTDKETALILIAISCFAKCKDCLKHHILNALNIGITIEEIRDVFISGIIAAGASYVNFGSEVLKELGLE
jgi:AhpD family alkylhydroperoxidase